ncbi:MAG: peptidase T [Sphaerochaeta sp.]|jgi:tripeptide aminopeptidase|nr:peptidase T [Sphaerochaeta sp.]MCH3919034.1 peptidase T [Sphaerochaeta sp.]MCI2044890.1 peptidase T [Sphaerochaeta sp.]MCI2075803.1 peptidase T [Sphaerochaeta sp.]MCI2096424.1 peptidase T [Sphaerochaeta sp.]
MADALLDRFLRYVKVDTMSDEALAETNHPSTEIQWNLLRLLDTELAAMGVTDREMDEHGILIARIPANTTKKVPTIGLMAHVDTADDCQGNGVKPRVIPSYDGKDILLNKTVTLKVSDNPELPKYVGQTLIVTDGTTLLGSDDKAGVAEIMTVADRLLHDPSCIHGPVELYFTSDEETGCGMDHFPYDKIHCDYCYTVDGGERYCIETECFNAAVVRLDIHGVSYHLGAGRGRLINAVKVAGMIIDALPQAESPEATDGRFGYYCPLEVSGALAEVKLNVVLRDFDLKNLEKRIQVVKGIAGAMESAYGCTIDVVVKHQYYNMVEEANKHPAVVQSIWQAGKELGMPLFENLIRGGTDGARMANERHIPCPNLFTGGHNLHSVYEWAALPAMEDSVKLVSRIIEIGARG